MYTNIDNIKQPEKDYPNFYYTLIFRLLPIMNLPIIYSGH